MTNEWLTWGLPIGLSVASITFGIMVLQFGELSTEEFWVARSLFVIAALIWITRFAVWEAFTSRSLALRTVVGIIVLGAGSWFAIESVRYVNRRQGRWVNAQKPLSPSTPQPSETVKTPREAAGLAATPNLVFKGRELLMAHCLWGGPLVEGRNTHQYNFEPDVLVLALKVENEFSDLFKAIPVQDVTAQLSYVSEDGKTLEVNRGAWLSNGNRIYFAVNEYQHLIVAVITGNPPEVLAIFKEYEEHGGFEKVSTKLADDLYAVRVRLISENVGTVFLDKKFSLQITREPKFLIDFVPD